jgi:flagellar biosynthesis/type III secretory pathway protein FliH
VKTLETLRAEIRIYKRPALVDPATLDRIEREHQAALDKTDHDAYARGRQDGLDECESEGHGL